MKNYKDLADDILRRSGQVRKNRTGIDTKAVFGRMLSFDLRQGFPLLTLRPIHVRSITHELLWFLSGETNVKYLRDNDVTIWDEWADENGNLGPVYGAQWRHWKTTGGGEVDQIKNLVQTLRTNPESRRMIVSAWNPEFVDSMALPPCHTMWQCNASAPGEDGKRTLDLMLYQRSADLGLGVPFNIASYAMLLHMLAHVSGMHAGTFTHAFGDVHIYENHFAAFDEMQDRESLPLPHLVMNPAVQEIDDFKFADIEVVGYAPHPKLKNKMPVAV